MTHKWRKPKDPNKTEGIPEYSSTHVWVSCMDGHTWSVKRGSKDSGIARCPHCNKEGS